MKRFYLTHVFAEKRADGSIYIYSQDFSELYSTMKGVKACVSRFNKTNERGVKIYLGAYVRDKFQDIKMTTINGTLGWYDEEHGFLAVCGL